MAFLTSYVYRTVQLNDGRRVEGRRRARSHASVSAQPPPNRTGNFRCIRLSPIVSLGLGLVMVAHVAGVAEQFGALCDA